MPLPDPSSILPYLGLFTLAILDPDNVYGCHISTQHVPPLSILRNKHFEDAPEGTSPVDDNVARIFDVLAFVAPGPPMSHGVIPLSPGNDIFEQKRYWRLPVSIEGVFAALIARLGYHPYRSREAARARKISNILLLRYLDTIDDEESVPTNDKPGLGKRNSQSCESNEPPSKRGRTRGASPEELDRVGTLKSRQAEISETEFSNESGEFFPLHFTLFQ